MFAEGKLGEVYALWRCVEELATDESTVRLARIGFAPDRA